MQSNQRPLTGDPYQRAPYNPQGFGSNAQRPLVMSSQNPLGQNSQPRLAPFDARLSNQNIPVEQARIRAHSPLKISPGFDINTQSTNLTNSAQQPGQLRRPMSQIPTQSRGYGSNLNETGSISNYDRKGVSPNLVGNKSIGNFQRFDKEALRDQISLRNKNVKELAINKKFFEETLNKKNAEFKEKIRADLKAKIFDKVLKSNLHYIYKHYENVRSNINRQEALKVLNINIAKQNVEVKTTRSEIADMEKNNRVYEQRLLESANKIGLIKATPELVENISKVDIEAKIAELNIENQDIEKNLGALKQWKDKQLYDLKFKHEIKGRRLMEEKAIRLALQYVDPSDPEQVALKHQVEVMLKEIDLKNQSRKASEVYKLQAKRDKLAKELELLKFSKV
jgi:hypothetical protein